MADFTPIPVKIRHARGTRAVERLRREGQIPAVLYGHQLDTVAISVNGETVSHLLRHGAHGLIELDVEGKKESVVIKELQRDAFGREILHIDFARVSADERITVDVPVALRGSPPGVAEGGILNHAIHSVEIECSAATIVQQITVSVNNLHLGQSVLLKDLKVPEGAKVLGDPEAVVVEVAAPKEEAEEAAEAPAEGAEPELIRREAKEEEEGE
jgi:large subunit ribosomal protein L25